MFLGSCFVIFLSLRAYGHLDGKLEFIENGVRMSPFANVVAVLVKAAAVLPRLERM